MKRVYNGLAEKDKFLKDIQKEEHQGSKFIMLNDGLINEMGFLRELMRVKSNKFTVGVDSNGKYILAEPIRNDDGAVAFIDISLEDVLTKF